MYYIIYYLYTIEIIKQINILKVKNFLGSLYSIYYKVICKKIDIHEKGNKNKGYLNLIIKVLKSIKL